MLDCGRSFVFLRFSLCCCVYTFCTCFDLFGYSCHDMLLCRVSSHANCHLHIPKAALHFSFFMRATLLLGSFVVPQKEPHQHRMLKNMFRFHSLDVQGEGGVQSCLLLQFTSTKSHCCCFRRTSVDIRTCCIHVFTSSTDTHAFPQ